MGFRTRTNGTFLGIPARARQPVIASGLWATLCTFLAQPHGYPQKMARAQSCCMTGCVLCAHRRTGLRHPQVRASVEQNWFVHTKRHPLLLLLFIYKDKEEQPEPALRNTRARRSARCFAAWMRGLWRRQPMAMWRVGLPWSGKEALLAQVKLPVDGQGLAMPKKLASPHQRAVIPHDQGCASAVMGAAMPQQAPQGRGPPCAQEA